MTDFIALPDAGRTKRAGVLIFHGGQGPSDHERARAKRLADVGYVALAPDLFDIRFESRAHGIEFITGLVERPGQLRARVRAALDRLRAHPLVDANRCAAIGFCFGGLAALELARSGADVRCVVTFHGGLTTRAPARQGEVRASLLVCTGASDAFVTREHRVAFEDEMTAAGAAWQMHVHSSAQHGFTHEGTSAHDELADRRSWTAMLALFQETLLRDEPGYAGSVET